MDKPADVYHAIADANRRRILDLLRDGERSVQELVPHVGVTVGAVSQHLGVLSRSRLVTCRRQGRYRFYRIRPQALREVRDWTERYRRFWNDRLDGLEAFLDGED